MCRKSKSHSENSGPSLTKAIMTLILPKWQTESGHTFSLEVKEVSGEDQAYSGLQHHQSTVTVASVKMTTGHLA